MNAGGKITLHLAPKIINGKKVLHTVLGASGAIGQAVVRELKNKNLPIRQVRQRPEKNNTTTITANLLDKDEAIKAIYGSSHVYLCVGLAYNAKTWQRDWPIIMENVIEACMKTNAKLIFFDNAYMYGPTPLSIPFNEKTPQNPTTIKGIARKKTTEILLQAMQEKKLEAVIGRSAGFYGINATYGQFYLSFLENMLKGKAPQVLAPKGVPQAYAFTEDNAKALVTLALEDSAYGEVWHLPVAEPITFDDALSIFNKQLGSDFKISYIPFLMRKILGLFIKPIKEVEEMRFIYEHHYQMDYSKFRAKFPSFQVTPYEQGIQQMIASFRK